ncbi:oligosaccharide flippase family protein [Ruminococcus sp. CLA-AA-H200]|uniref:Oligosaccharide flippase family protein n=1 Tax=Ruminococcus turbiniformis TaxID=2881258 RepID=A0ABS8FWW9_9FIRM|nr:oligosaccharide flippase family protein [Ruminococcus turbiniformis]MCC2254134.1 oligosaccharide flippase family protein [Ruminococcus turbiniformis]
MRKTNSLKNFITSTVPFIILIILGFWKVNVWQNTLDEDVYALNQLFFQIFAYLSLAEAGIGALVQKEYYKFFVNMDKEKIRIYFTLSKKMLRTVCFIIMAAGIAVSFFLPALANDNDLSLRYMQEIFILFLISSLVEYFMFSPRFVLQADQKLYKINVQMNIYKIVEAVIGTLMIMFGMSYEAVLVMTIILRIVMNLHMNRIIYREYPWLKPVKDTKGIKIRGMQHVLLYKVVSVIYENVDMVLISAFVNPLAVIIYSNYKYITKYLSDLLYQVATSITSSMGNLLNTERDEHTFYTYEMISTMFYFVGCFLTAALGYSINSFIVVWVGDGKLFDSVSLACILFTLYHNVVRRPQYMLKDIFALYKELQIVSIAEAALNTVLSLALVIRFGISGVLVATVISTMLTNFWYFPKYLYREVFDKGPWLDIVKYLCVLAWAAAIVVLSNLFLPPIPDTGYVAWFVGSCIYSLGVLAVLFVLFFAMFRSFRRLVAQSLDMVRGILRKGRE